MSLFAELKRRNVVCIGLAYAVIGWLPAQIVDSLGVHLTDSDAKALAHRPTNNVSAYNAYLKGQARGQQNAALRAVRELPAYRDLLIKCE